MGIFVTPYDIANVGLQLIGVPRITTFSDSSRQAKEAGFIYDKARRSELRRFVWTFATRRAVIRPITATTKPLVFPTWSSLTTYAAGDLVSYSSVIYESLVASNLNKTPNTDVGQAFWEVYAGPAYADTYSSSATYFPGDVVVSAGTVYRLAALVSQTNLAPPGNNWIAPVSVTLGAAVVFRSPQGFDAPGGTTVRSAYPLPLNYLRMAPQDPKQPAIARLGTTAGMEFNDFEIENDALYSVSATGPLILRFVSDIVSVSVMDDLFCHALGCRIALDLNEAMSQRADLAQKAAAEYNRFITEARLVSAVEMGSTEQDLLLPQPAPAPAGR